MAAQRGDIGPKHLHRHANMAKAESSLVTQIRTEKIGLASFLCRRRVPGVLTEYCSYCDLGKRQTAKHILLFCHSFQTERLRLFNGSERMDYWKLVDNPRWLQRAARWMIERGILAQYSLAKRCLYDEE